MNRLFVLTSLVAALVVGGCDGRVDQPAKPAVEAVRAESAPDPMPPSPPDQAVAKSSRKGFVFTGLDGFEGPSEKGVFTNAKLRVTIVPAFQPGAKFEDIVKEFTDENLQKSSMTARERVMKEVDGRKTYFVKGDRIGGKSPRMFTSVIYRAGSGCAQLTAIYPADTTASIQESLDSTLLNSNYFE